jgi:predicted MFS family arabinose efflux permease
VIGDLFGWRGVFGALSLFSLGVAIAAFFRAPRGRSAATRVIRSRRGARQFPQHLRRPTREGVLRVGVFEAIFIHGLFPYVALLLVASGEARASIAGLLIATFAIGGVLYSFSIPLLITRFRERRLMLLGAPWLAAP